MPETPVTARETCDRRRRAAAIARARQSLLFVKCPRFRYACDMPHANCSSWLVQAESFQPPGVEVVIEIPRGSFIKRESTSDIDFISPLPCPYNYGSVPQLLGLEGDLLDALILGPRLARGTRIQVKAWGAVMLTDRGMTDDKLICSERRPSALECQNVLRFFHWYAKSKGVLNIWRRRPGRNACDGWCEAAQALARARPRPPSWKEAPVEF
jgi:inorganic pyrophosphatase